MPFAVVAIGGNALTRAGERGTIEEQFANARFTCAKLAHLIDEGWDIVLTHGNGPQVGSMLWRVELAAQQVHPVDLGICDANTQGQIGYMLQQVLSNQLRACNNERDVVTLVTQVEVDPDDPAFLEPTKPIGPFFTAQEAEEKRKTLGWVMKEDAGRGWRRVVPSPKPKRIVELNAIRMCVRAGIIPIAVGGGGIPVMRRAARGFDGLEAVVDKDLSASLLARRIGADVLIICTGVANVSIDYGKPQERPLHRATVSELVRYQREGQFPEGSMGPKITACIDFVTGGGVGTRRRAMITDMHNLQDAIAGKAGTVIAPDDSIE